MLSSRAFIGTATVLILLCAAQTRSNAEPEASGRSIPLGEKLEYEGYWMGIPVGNGNIEVGPSVEDFNGTPAYRIRALGRTSDVLSAFYPIEDRVEIVINAESYMPLFFEKDQREGNYRAHERVTFDHSQHQAQYQSLLNNSTKQVDIPDVFYEMLSSLYWFRTIDLQPEQTHSVKLYTDEKIYDTDIVVRGRECLELLKRGTFPTIVVEPKASFKGLLVKRGRIWAYLSDDEHRIPLLVKATTPWGPMSAVISEESIPESVKRECE